MLRSIPLTGVVLHGQSPQPHSKSSSHRRSGRCCEGPWWVAEMDELHFAVKEALRMHPPLIMMLRQCHKPFEVTTTKGQKYVVPKVGRC